jgi:sodium transport system permease protein
VRLTRPIRAVFGLEIRSLLRDRRTLIMSVIVPVVLLPLFLLGSSWVEDRRTDREGARTYRLAIGGTEASFARAVLAGGNGTTGLRTAPPDWGELDTATRFREVSADAPERALEQDSVDVFLEALTAGEWEALERAGEVETDSGSGQPPANGPFAGARVFRIHFNSSRNASREGVRALQAHLAELREARKDSILDASSFPVAREEVARVVALNVATEDQVQGAMLGRYLTLILLGLMVLGGSALSIDTLAGEKERGTLATLLTSAATRNELISGKLLAVMAVAFAIAAVQILNLWIFLGLGLVDPPAGFALHVTPALAVTLLALYLPVVALTASILLLSSAYANSYKEAQLYMTPVLLGLLVPAFVPMLPDISLPSAIVVVPVANLAVAVRDVLVGQVHGPSLAASWAITAAAAAWVTSRCVRALHDEKVVTGDTTRAEFLGGPELFRHRVLRWFLVFWAVKLILDLNVTFDDIRFSVLFSVGFLFLAFPLLVIRHFRLDPARALALRMPRPGVWPWVLIGAPAGIVAAQTVFRLMDFVIPVPAELLENFGQSLMPETVPTWQLFLLIALLPGIAEELTFRGVLLHGLRRRFGTLGLSLVVGGIFGFFHFQIFRIPATAFLGVVLTLVTIYSGSIFPAMLWHTLNNGIAVFLATRGWTDPLESWALGAGSFVVLFLALWMIRRFGTPYPDVGREGVPREAEVSAGSPGPGG